MLMDENHYDLDDCSSLDVMKISAETYAKGVAKSRRAVVRQV